MKEKKFPLFPGEEGVFLKLLYTPNKSNFFVNFNFVVGEGDDAGEGGDN